MLSSSHKLLEILQTLLEVHIQCTIPDFPGILTIWNTAAQIAGKLGKWVITTGLRDSHGDALYMCAEVHKAGNIAGGNCGACGVLNVCSQRC